MKISITVVMIFTTLFCLLPYIWFIMMAQINTKKKKQQIAQVVKDLKLSFTEKEQWNHHLIGYHKAHNTLTFITLHHQEPMVLTIQLNQLKECHINMNTKAVLIDKKRDHKLLTIDLELILKSNEAPITLNFYDYREEFAEDLELHRVQKWETLVKQSQINTIEPPKAA